VKSRLKISFKVFTLVRTGCENRNRNFKIVFKKELDGFSHENPKSIQFQGLKQIWFIGSSYSSSHMGLLLLPPRVLLLTWGCYSSPLASVFFFGRNFANWRPKKKKPSATSTKNVFCEIFQNIRHIS
jgi:hypothetical protein